MNDTAKLQTIIADAFASRAQLSTDTQGDIRDAVNAVMDALDAGQLRVAQKHDGKWQVNEWVKQAILLSFRLNPNQLIHGSIGDHGHWYDKVPNKWEHWDEAAFKAAGFRAVPGAIARKGSFIAPDVVLMPSFINIGAYVGEGTMVDTWATIGSCAQIGAHCHISGGVGIGGVLEPLQANPVIIEDNCFIGARSEIAEGMMIEQGAVISMGVYLGISTKIIDRATGEIFYGRVPAYSVVVPGNVPGKTPDAPSLYCAVIVKRVDEKTRSKTSINELLRA
jgi:2,3,4,5-tetrahydropyridine-2-carboxylate N-succinyltransferase